MCHQLSLPAADDWKVKGNWSNDDGSNRFPNSFSDTFTATVAPTGGATVNLLGGQSGAAAIHLDGLNVGAGSTIVVDTQSNFHDSSLQLRGDIRNDGTIVLRDQDPADGSRNLSLLRFDGSGRQLSGSGRVVFDTGNQNIIDAVVTTSGQQSASLEIGSEQMITTSAGGHGAFGITLTNRGTIRADAGGSITIGQGSSDANTNAGVIGARNGGTLEIAWELDNTGGVIDIGAGSEVTQRAIVRGGMVQGSGTLRSTSNLNAGLDGVAIGAGVEALAESVGNRTRGFVLSGTIRNDGRLRLNDTAAGTGAAWLLIQGPVTIDGSGEIVFDSPHSNTIACRGSVCADGTSGSLVLGAGQTTRIGAGNNGRLAVVTDNRGTMYIDGTLTQTLIGSPTMAPFVNSGLITGSGRIDVRGQYGFRNDGTLAPGNSPGILTFGSSYRQSAQGTLAIELGGNTFDLANSLFEYDRLVVDGTAYLDGLLDITLIDGFLPDNADIFTILTATDDVLGTFANTPGNLLSFSGGTFDVIYGTDFVQLANFTPAAAGVPEPPTWLLYLAGGVLLLPHGRQRRFQHTQSVHHNAV